MPAASEESELPIHHRPDWDYTFHLLIGHPDGGRVFLLDKAGGWALPHFRPVEHDLRAVGHIQRAAKRQLGFDTRVLRCVALERDETEKRAEAVFALEILADAEHPRARGDWLDRERLDGATLVRSDHRHVLLDQASGPGDRERCADRHPWVLPGWQAEIEDWAAAQLLALGEGPPLAIEQARTWDLSCVLRLRTVAGRRYLKALPPDYRGEVGVTHFLAGRFPGAVPAVLAVEQERGWLLLEDAGSAMDNARLDRWERAVDQIATMQRASAADIAALLALGCQDQRPAALAVQAEALLVDPRVRAALDANEYARLHAAIPRLREYCAALDAYGPPPTLVHGDLHTGNIAQEGEQLTFFDWGDACITHPFLVLVALLDPNDLPPDATENARRLRGRYLAHWSDDCPPELAGDTGIVDALAWLRYTLGCLRCFPSLGTLWERELTRSLQSCLRRLLRAG